MSSSFLTISNRLHWFPRFRLRTLIALFTLAVCLIPVCWWATKTEGRDDAARRYMRIDGRMFGYNATPNATAVFPFVLRVNVFHSNYSSLPWTNRGPVLERQFEDFYCVWFFGIVAKLPFTTTWGELTTTNVP